MKAALLLEAASLDHAHVPVDTWRGERHRPEYTALNPDAKAPTPEDGETVVFDSDAILLHLNERTGRFLPPDTPRDRGALPSWLAFAGTGAGPYSGQCVHFRHLAPETMPRAPNRYTLAARRHWGIVDDQLAGGP